MNQEKIGKFIADLRKGKKLTQTELAKRIGVSNKTVSKWECGNAIPDYGVFDNLCKEFDITVNELLNGEKDEKDDKVIGEYMKMKGKENTNRIIIISVISFLIILCFVFGTFFFNSYKTIKMYELIAINDNFSYTNGTYLESKITTVFTEGQFKISNPAITEEDIIDKMFAIKEDGKYYWFGNVTPGVMSYEKYLYGDKFSIAELQHLPHDLYIIVWYYFDGEILCDQIKVEAKEILSNDKLVDFKIEHIAVKPNIKLNDEIKLDRYSKSNEYMNYLLAQGFKESQVCKKIEKECSFLEKVIDEETIIIDFLEKTFYYKKGDVNSIESHNHCYNEGPFCRNGYNGEFELSFYEKIDSGDYFYRRHFYNSNDKTIDFKKIYKDNEKYMVYFNRFKELYDKYRPQEE